MQTSRLISAFILIFSFNAMLAQKVVITGNVSNTKAKTATCSYNEYVLYYKAARQSAAIDKKGKFKFELELSGMKKIYLIIDEQQTSFYVEPGDNIAIKINYADFDKSIVFTGHNSEKNKLLKAYDDKFVFGHENDSYQQNINRKAGDFAAYCDSLLSEELNFVSAFVPRPSAEFTGYFKASLVYENANNKLRYPSFWAYAHHKGDTLPELPNGYFSFIEELPLNNEALLDNTAYYEYIKAAGRINQSYNIHPGAPVASLSSDALNAAKSTAAVKAADLLQASESILKNDKVLQAYDASVIYNALRYEEFAATEKLYTQYIKKNGKTQYTEELTEEYNKVRKIAPGQMAPAFTLTDDKGRPCSLADYKGKVVYLDFWASWCGPCLRELPYSKKLKEEFDGKDIVFLYVSIDEDAKSWKDAIAKKNISGVHVNAPDFDHPVAQSYNISGVPTYFLIGKDGKIISNNPPRPSAEAAVRKEIGAALQN